ncbi:uncharacterized protein LOC143048118 isoform X2 [Mytilus galloprovincialis]|uniref:uncharacterized protein LOC143048118 isoform X2 n=1 Tax=Mytilus galloprovincialis TaxID=29158 RepID=UPI003F7BE046
MEEYNMYLPILNKLTIDVFPEILRDRLESLMNHTQLPDWYASIRGRTFFSKIEEIYIFESPQKGYEQFDLSLSIKILKYLFGETTINSHLDTLCRIRNKLSHLPNTNITRDEFDSYFKQFCDVADSIENHLRRPGCLRKRFCDIRDKGFVVFAGQASIDDIQRQLNELQRNGEGITNSEIKQITMTTELDIQELEIKNKKEYVKLNELKKMLTRVGKTLEPPEDTNSYHIWKHKLDLPAVQTALPRNQIIQQALNGDKSTFKNQIICQTTDTTESNTDTVKEQSQCRLQKQPSDSAADQPNEIISIPHANDICREKRILHQHQRLKPRYLRPELTQETVSTVINVTQESILSGSMNPPLPHRYAHSLITELQSKNDYKNINEKRPHIATKNGDAKKNVSWEMCSTRNRPGKKHKDDAATKKDRKVCSAYPSKGKPSKLESTVEVDQSQSVIPLKMKRCSKCKREVDDALNVTDNRLVLRSLSIEIKQIVNETKHQLFFSNPRHGLDLRDWVEKQLSKSKNERLETFHTDSKENIKKKKTERKQCTCYQALGVELREDASVDEDANPYSPNKRVSTADVAILHSDQKEDGALAERYLNHLKATVIGLTGETQEAIFLPGRNVFDIEPLLKYKNIFVLITRFYERANLLRHIVRTLRHLLLRFDMKMCKLIPVFMENIGHSPLEFIPIHPLKFYKTLEESEQNKLEINPYYCNALKAIFRKELNFG